jgi:DNA repair exonuclease SbcCD ATPase subunit
MRLENFKGIKKLTIDLGGRNANIYGANGAGKTSLADAFTWLMFGKNYEGGKGFTPKTREGEDYTHNLDHSVECEMEIDGEIVTFRRVYHEVYKKTRGSAEANLTGHTTDYYINGVPKQEKEYARYWQSIFENDELPKILSMPYYFASEAFHWEKRRGILLDICGNVSDAEIMESDDELQKLAALVGRLSVDEFKKTVKARLADINRKLQTIPSRIDEAQKAIPNTAGLSASGIDASISKLSADIRQAEQERADILSSNDTVARTRARLAELNAALSEARSKYADREHTASAILYEKVKFYRENMASVESLLADRKRKFSQAQEYKTALEKKRADILSEHSRLAEEKGKVQSDVFDESATICPSCGQSLPQDKAAELREAFNLRKSNRLSDITAQMTALIERGRREASKEMLATVEQSVSDTENEAKTAQTATDVAAQHLSEAEQKMKQAIFPAFETTDEYKAFSASIEQIKNSERADAPDTSAIDEKISVYRQKQEKQYAAKSALETEAIQRARIAELEAEEKALGKAYEEAQYSMYLCEKFNQVKSSMLNDRINEKFRTVKFRLFKKNITNNGIEDVCDVLVPNRFATAFVDFDNDANGAARMNAGIEIIGVLSEHYGVEMPIFIDQAGEFTDIINTTNQQIKLYVSAQDETLRTELQ